MYDEEELVGGNGRASNDKNAGPLSNDTRSFETSAHSRATPHNAYGENLTPESSSSKARAVGLWSKL